MSESFFLRLRPSSETAQWCVGNANLLPAHNDQIRSGSIEEALDAAQTHHNGQRIVLIVPASDIVLSSVQLPIRQTNKLLQAVPYALEDQLAEDVEDLHFAIGQRQEDGSIPVASVARETLNQWLTPLNERGISPLAVVPEMLCLPAVRADSGWQVLIEGQDCIVRTGAYDGFCCQVSELADFLGMAQGDAESPEGLRLRKFQVTGSNEPELTGLVSDVETVNIKAGLACLMPQTLSGNINLLQGEYASEPSYERWWRPLKLTVILFVTWGLLATIYLGLQNWQLSSQLQKLQKENSQRFGQMFPEITRIVDMRAQGKQKLRELREGGSSAGLFGLLDATAQATKKLPDLKVQELQLR
ncbi:MAG: type II secretion system protein GspL, partial [Salinisphaeraceae bacterium]|nr:type II secretion system protein GspL [Salinisphaeraceae bacterium]